MTMAANGNNNWKPEKLEDICIQITDGKHGDCQNEPNSGFYFLSCKDVSNGKLNYKDARQITEADFLDTHRRTKFAPSDVLITNSGTIGRMALAPDNELTRRTTFQKSVAILKASARRVESNFLYYALQSDIRRLIEFAGGTAQKNLLLRDLRAFEVRVPPLPLQRRIAGILSAYDELMNNNGRRISILEKMARALYREWFVDFRFPSNEKIKFISSPLGNIPQGWRVKKLGDLITYKRLATMPGSHLIERRYVPIECLPSKSLALLEAKPVEEAQSSSSCLKRGTFFSVQCGHTSIRLRSRHSPVLHEQLASYSSRRAQNGTHSQQ
jgi:type I restriction enzyme, S subunit